MNPRDVDPATTDANSAESNRRTFPSLPLLLRQIEHELERRMAEGIEPVMREHDLTPERWRVVAALAARPDQTMTELSRASVLPPASLTRHVDRLVTRGLVVRRPDPSDGRRVVATLTEAGLTLCDRVQASEHEVHDSLRSQLGDGRFDSLVDELVRVPTMLSSHGEA